MVIVAIASAKGGVGRTTITASLATILGKRGHPVLALDFDPQNALRLHLGLESGEQDGFARRSVSGHDWGEAAFCNSDGVNFLPFGEMSAEERPVFEDLLRHDSAWLTQRLAQIDFPHDGIVLIDTERGPSEYFRQALAAADFTLAVLLPDAASYLTIPAMERLHAEYLAGRQPRDAALGYMLNQVDATRPLQADILLMMRARLGERLAPYPVHRDETVAEAFAAETSVPDYAAYGQAARDLQGLATWLVEHAAARSREKSA